MKKLVIIPTYNERENIINIINAVFELEDGFHVLVIDDGSPDKTARLVENRIKADPAKLFLLERADKEGLGTAYILGFKWALGHGYDYIFEMDADFSHPPKDLTRLLKACEEEGADVAVGSRYIKGGGTKNWPWKRNFLSRGASLYTRIITRIPVKDPTAGFVCYKRKVLETLDLDRIRFIGYAFQIEMKFKAWKQGFKVVEIPIVFTDREQGQSKMTRGIVKEGVLGVIKMQLESLKLKRT